MNDSSYTDSTSLTTTIDRKMENLCFNRDHTLGSKFSSNLLFAHGHSSIPQRWCLGGVSGLVRQSEEERCRESEESVRQLPVDHQLITS